MCYQLIEKKPLQNTLLDLSNFDEEIKELESNLANETTKKIDEAITLQLNRDHQLPNKIADKIELIKQDMVASEHDEEDDDVEDSVDVGYKLKDAITAYKRALRAQAKAHASNKKVPPKSLNGMLLKWLGERCLKIEDQKEVGSKLNILSLIRKFKAPTNRYIRNLPKRYKLFRRVSQKLDKWYRKTDYNPNDLHPLELDILIYSILNIPNKLLQKRSVVNSINESQWSTLKNIYNICMNQVYVDEATDFSPVQIACMSKLSYPVIDSFFACGDFNQRLTTWGCNKITDIERIGVNLQVQKVNVVYRQSETLIDFASKIINLIPDSDKEVLPTLPQNFDFKGVKPALLENENSLESVCSWIASRIFEVEKLVGKLPSIAVLVEDETEVQPTAKSLNSILSRKNIQAIPCPGGQVMGNDSDVRVFDIQHIKGLEFEAVFFVGIDRLAKRYSDLFDKYLYVGATRAATYLGVTCEGELPNAISELRAYFTAEWPC